VCTCICFCHYIEQQLQEMHDDAQVMVTRLLEGQQQQQHDAPAANGHGSSNQQQQQHSAAANGHGSLPQPRASSSNGGGTAAQQQQQQQAEAAAAAEAKLRVLSRPIGDFSSCRREWVLKLGKAAAMGFMQQAAGAFAPLLWCRSAALLRAVHAVGVGVVWSCCCDVCVPIHPPPTQPRPPGYVSRGAMFKPTTDALPALAAEGVLWSSGVVSGELQVGAVCEQHGAWDGGRAMNLCPRHSLHSLRHLLSHVTCAASPPPLQPALAWLAMLLEHLSHHLDKHCFRQAWGAAAAALNRCVLG
jgi:hypothetical protein